MFIRDFLTAGDYITLVPIGLMLKVQYNDSGMIEKIYNWLDGTDYTKEFLSIILDNDTIPRKLPIVDGTSWVYGVLLNPESTILTTGDVPDCVTSSIVSHFKRNPEVHKFYAADVTSNAKVFKAAVSTRQWLISAGFETLAGFIMPAEMTEDNFVHVANLAKSPLPFPRISGYYVFHNGRSAYHKLGFKQHSVSAVKQHVDINGRIYGRVIHESGEFEVDYSEVVKHNIQPNSLILCGEDDEVLWYHAPSVNAAPRPTKIPCPICGKMLLVKLDEITQCSDPHCNSKLFSKVNQLLSTLGLETLSFSDYRVLTAQYGPDFSVVDALNDVRHESKFPMKVSFPTLLRAIIPYAVISESDTSVISAICNRCNNLNSTIEYYLLHPDKLASSDIFAGLRLNSLVMWLSDEQNQSDLTTLINSSRFEIVGAARKFEGAPIFRSNTIAITGQFMHGSYQDIVAILQSYSATVVSEFSPNLMCLVIGDMQEDVNGHLVKECRFHHVPVVSESEFFAKFDIDSDLIENLK